MSTVFVVSPTTHIGNGVQDSLEKAKLNALRDPLQDGCATERDLRSFYDHIANLKVGGVVLSMKADTIRASGEAINGYLSGRNRILDLGCGIGYLSSWYASVNSDRKVVGVDISEKSIRQARRVAERLGIQNVEFKVGDCTKSLPCGPAENTPIQCSSL